MPQSENDSRQMAIAYGWVARMTTVVLEMILPGLGGDWLDSRWGTNYWVVAGFGVGFALGIFHLLHMVKERSPKIPNDDEHPSSNNH